MVHQVSKQVPQEEADPQVAPDLTARIVTMSEGASVEEEAVAVSGVVEEVGAEEAELLDILPMTAVT
jgi:hypothetical protein